MRIWYGFHGGNKELEEEMLFSSNDIGSFLIPVALEQQCLNQCGTSMRPNQILADTCMQKIGTGVLAGGRRPQYYHGRNAPGDD